MVRMVVIADDLTGAADCAASSAALGYRTVVLLHSPEEQQSEAWPEADILSIDANSRCLPAKDGAELTAQLVHQCDLHNADCPGYMLFKKIDSTLRGNVAGEIAALLHARRSLQSSKSSLSVVMAPALPAQGRTTVDGRMFVHGAPLEQTDIWQAEGRAAQSDIPALLAEGGLSCGLIRIDVIRSASTFLQQAILESSSRNDVVVCDAETDADLRRIVDACADKPTVTALVGSAGLASQVSGAIGIDADKRTDRWEFCDGPTLFVVGTTASVSREQAGCLEGIPAITTFRVTPSALFNSANTHALIVQSLQSGCDVLLVLDGGEQCANDEEQLLTPALAEVVSKCAEFVGGLVATGGETARAVLDAMRIRRLHVLGEVEAGLPICIADGWVRPLPVITKAGAFGSTQSLIRCREFLSRLDRLHVEAEKVLPDYES